MITKASQQTTQNTQHTTANIKQHTTHRHYSRLLNRYPRQNRFRNHSGLILAFKTIHNATICPPHSLLLEVFFAFSRSSSFTSITRAHWKTTSIAAISNVTGIRTACARQWITRSAPHGGSSAFDSPDYNGFLCFLHVSAFSRASCPSFPLLNNSSHPCPT